MTDAQRKKVREIWLSAVDAPSATVELVEEIRTLRRLLEALKRGDCWCDVGIGAPYATSHSLTCREIQALVK